VTDVSIRNRIDGSKSCTRFANHILAALLYSLLYIKPRGSLILNDKLGRVRKEPLSNFEVPQQFPAKIFIRIVEHGQRLKIGTTEYEAGVKINQLQT
jgi:hypothetical protein